MRTSTTPKRNCSSAHLDGTCTDVTIDLGLPHVTVGSAPALSVSRPVLSVHSGYNLQTCRVAFMRPSTPEAPAASLPPPPLRQLPGGAIQFPGESFFSQWTSA